MTKDRRTFIFSIALTLIVTVGTALLVSWLPFRAVETEVILDDILKASLHEQMDIDSSLVCGMASIKETGSVRDPRIILMARNKENSSLWEGTYGYDRVTVLPEGLMHVATYTYFIDRKYVKVDNVIPTMHGVVSDLEREAADFTDPKIIAYEKESGCDSITVRQGFLLSSRYVADWMAIGDRRRLDDSRWLFIQKFDDYFGSSEGCYVPKAKYQYLPIAASIADGSGVLLTQQQILTFFDALANGGIRPRHRYIRARRICSEETANQMTALLRENVIAGTGIPLKDLPVSVAGKTGSGELGFGYVPGVGAVRKGNPLTVASFAGHFPADDPRYTMCVTIYSDDGNNELEDKAMSIFGEIVKNLKLKGML